MARYIGSRLKDLRDSVIAGCPASITGPYLSNYEAVSTFEDTKSHVRTTPELFMSIKHALKNVYMESGEKR